MDINGKNNTLRIGGHASQTTKHNYDIIKIDIKGNVKNNQDKASCFTAGAHSGGNHSDMDLIQIVAMRGRNPENTSDRTKGCPTKQMLEAREDGKTNCITTVQKDNLVYTKYNENQFNNKRLNETIDLHKDNLEEGTMIDSYNKSIHKDKSITITTRVNASSSTHIVHTSALNENQKDNLVYTENYLQYGSGFAQDSRAYYEDGKHGTLDIKDKRAKVLSQSRIRRLTPIECCRLQTINDDYFIKDGVNVISNSQIYKCVGNGWTVEVIAHIFSFLKP
jgi:site-specific DNA-cytosine methylase